MFWLYLIAIFIAAYMIERVAYFVGWTMYQSTQSVIPPRVAQVYFYLAICGVWVVFPLAFTSGGDGNQSALYALFVLALVFYVILGMTQVFRRAR